MSVQQNFLDSLEEWADAYMFRSLTEYFDFIKSSGISIQQAYVLTFLHYNGPSKIAEICDHMMGTTAAASQMVKRLVGQEFVVRTIDPADRRARNVDLTKRGRQFVHQSIAARRDWVKDLHFEWGAVQLNEITAALKLLTSVFQD